jgi:hypothetical protein
MMLRVVVSHAGGFEMPLHESVRLDCGCSLDELRPMSIFDAPIVYPACHAEHASWEISLFSAHSDGRVLAGSPTLTHHAPPINARRLIP